MPECILTLHPEGKQGVTIEKHKYEQIKTAILENLNNSQSMTFKELSDTVKQSLKGKFEESVSWHSTIVKLDLEAREIIKRVPGSSS